MGTANFYQVFKNERICKYAKPYCEYDGDERTGCGKGTLDRLDAAGRAAGRIYAVPRKNR